jgi:hypothetical protein
MKKILLILPLVFWLGCEDEKEEPEDCAGVAGGDNICGCTDITAINYDSNATFDDGSCEENYLIFTNKEMYNSPVDPIVEVEYCTLDQSATNHIFYERVWVRHFASFTLSASSTIVLKSLEFSWEIIDQYETDPSEELYWEYGVDNGGWEDISDDKPLTITYGTKLKFRLRDNFVGSISVGGHPPPENLNDSLDRIRIHDILDFYSVPIFPFEARAIGYYLLSQSDTSNFNVVHLDTFTVTIDSTECS